MASIVRNKVGNHTYLYESESYRDSDGKPQTRKTSIGKIDPVTGEPVFKPEYLERVRGTDKQPALGDIKQYSENDIKNSSIRDFGAFYLLEAISNEIGLIDVLRTSLPATWEKVITLAFYMLSTGEPAMYCEDWLLKTESMPCGSMSSQKISELLTAISNEERMTFYEKWGELRSELEYLALDITSISSYSDFIGDVEWGYNRDHEQLAQINVCMLLGEKSGLPVFQTTYSGSVKDVSTLKTTLQLATGLRLSNISLVMDKGFSSKGNIDTMLDDEDGIRFLVATPLTMNFTKSRIDGEKSDIDSLDKTIVIGDDIVRGVARKCAWSKDHDIYAHTFFNAEHAYSAKNQLFGHVAKLKMEALKDPNNPKFTKDFKKYLVIRKNQKHALGYTVNFRYDVIEKALQHSGWMILVSNHIFDATEALEVYRSKDIVEKGFLRMKNCLDLGRLRVHSDHRMQSKLFIGFIALIVMAHIHKIMATNRMYEHTSMKKMLKALERLRVQHINGHRILYPLTAEHKSIFKAFGLPHPV